MIVNYIYLLQEREFIRLNEQVYKIGKTSQHNLKRFNQYPKSSKLLIHITCNNCDMLEKKLIKLFKKTYIHKKEYGNEYFQGDLKKMIQDIVEAVLNEEIEIDDEINDITKKFTSNVIISRNKYKCENCKRNFRGNYELEQHLFRYRIYNCREDISKSIVKQEYANKLQKYKFKAYDDKKINTNHTVKNKENSTTVTIKFKEDREFAAQTVIFKNNFSEDDSIYYSANSENE